MVESVELQDLYPTIATAIGVSLEANQKLDGRSVWAALRNANAQDNVPFLIAGGTTATTLYANTTGIRINTVRIRSFAQLPQFDTDIFYDVGYGNLGCLCSAG